MLNLVNKFSIEEALKFGWSTTKLNFSFLVKIILIVAVAYLVSGLIRNGLKDIPVLSFLTAILFWVFHIVLDIGLIKIALKFNGSQKPDFEDLYNHYPLFWQYLAGSLLSGLIVLGGFILLIIPGIYFSVKLQFVQYLIVDRGLGPMEAIQKSWKMTEGSFWNLLILDIILGAINVLGALALLIGLLWTIPTSSIATAFVYRKLAH